MSISSEAVPDSPVVAAVKATIQDPNQPFTMLITFKVKEGTAEKFLAALLACTAETVREKGNIAYQVSRDVDHSNSFLLYERWKTINELKAHMDLTHTKAFLSIVPDVLDGDLDIKVMQAVGD